VTNDILARIIKRNPIRSQREACTIAARRSVAAFGPCRTDAEIKDACIGLASGLFGDVYFEAEQGRLLAMMEEEYRKALGPRSHASSARRNKWRLQ